MTFWLVSWLFPPSPPCYFRPWSPRGSIGVDRTPRQTPPAEPFVRADSPMPSCHLFRGQASAVPTLSPVILDASPLETLYWGFNCMPNQGIAETRRGMAKRREGKDPDSAGRKGGQEHQRGQSRLLGDTVVRIRWAPARCARNRSVLQALSATGGFE